MIITEAQFTKAMAEINTSFISLTKRVKELEDKAAKPITNKATK